VFYVTRFLVSED